MRQKVLIVEDQFLIAMALEEAIAKLGHDVVGIAAGKSQALDFIDAADVALVDINLLDGTSGVAIAQELSKRGMTTVFMTANPELVRSGVRGVLGIIAKPISDSHLASLMKFIAARRTGRHGQCPLGLILFEEVSEQPYPARRRTGTHGPNR